MWMSSQDTHAVNPPNLIFSRLQDCALSTDRGHLSLVAKAKVRMVAATHHRSNAFCEVATLLERGGRHSR